MVVVSAGHVGGIRSSGIVSIAADVLWMSVVREMRGVGGVCEMCMCLARGGVGGDGVSGLEDWVWALPILCERVECWTCVCVWVVVVWVVSVGSGKGLGPGSGGVGWCYVCVR